jgi:hypothetical protein
VYKTTSLNKGRIPIRGYGREIQSIIDTTILKTKIGHRLQVAVKKYVGHI